MLMPFLVDGPVAPTLDRQPTTMEVVGYQCVRRALKDGTPDPDAADNAYIRTRTQWFLLLDTDTVPVGKDGKRHVELPPTKDREFRKVEESGRIRGRLAKMFTEVSAPNRHARGKAVAVGSGESGGLVFDQPACQRTLYWRVRTVAEHVETHTDGGRRATRTMKETHWAVAAEGWYQDRPFIPRPDAMIAFEAGPHVQVDAPRFGYGAFVWPRDDEF